ncbi:MAG: DNA polymerase III subunit beta [Patescibacteria group bacterium]|nr:DNA polymerase III subunit beta [Patescibacteria group bacterium]
MKLVCTQENLNKALNVVGKIVNKNTTLPILNNVLLKTDKGRLKLISTNLELGVDYWVGGKIEEEGEITVPTKLFANFISTIPSGNIEMKLRGDVLSVKCGGYKTNIKAIDAKEYPLIPKIEMKPIFKIKSADFKRALFQVLPSISNSESRIEITGVFMDLSELDKNKLILVATDSYRLAEKTLKLEKENINKETVDLLKDIKSIIIPKSAIQEIVRDLDNEDEMVEITVSENQILFSFGNTSVISRLIEGKYPDYKQIIPSKFESEVKIKIDEGINAIKVASLFANASSNSVELKLLPKSKSLEINAETSDVGSNNSKISAEITGKELTVVYNYRYLLDGLNSISDDKVILKVNGEGMPTVLSSDTDKSFLYVIMSIRS